MAERGEGAVRYSLAPTNVSVQYGARGGNTAAGVGNEVGFFDPLSPLLPMAPAGVAGRRFDFQPGYNLQTRTRAYEGISFADLKMLAESFDLLRTIIETRKDQVERMEWAIKAKEGKKVAAAEIDRVTAFFNAPDGPFGEYDFARLLRELLEDLFVIDAPALFCERNRGGQLIGLTPIAGATIKPVIDAWGRRPRPFTQGGAVIFPVAYQQILKGVPAVDYTARDLIYAPRNRRSDKVFGFSPVEQIVMTVSIALRRQQHQLNYYTAGNIPESLIGVPDTWNPSQIKDFQDYWDLYFTGDSAKRRQAKFVPGGVAKTFIQTREPEMKNVFDEWLARIICFAFSVSPQALVAQQNRATADTQKELSEEEGLVPVMSWAKRLFTGIIQREFNPDVEFVWGGDKQIDPAIQKEILVGYVNAGMMTRRRAAELRGEELPDDPMVDQLLITTGAGVVPLNSYQQDQEQKAQQAALQTQVLAEARETGQAQQEGDEGRQEAPQGQGEAPAGSKSGAESSKSDAEPVKSGRERPLAAPDTSKLADVVQLGVVDGIAAAAEWVLTKSEVALDFAPAGTFTKAAPKLSARERRAYRAIKAAMMDVFETAMADVAKHVKAELRKHDAADLEKVDAATVVAGAAAIAAAIAATVNLSAMFDVAKTVGSALSSFAADIAEQSVLEAAPDAADGILESTGAAAVAWGLARAAGLIGRRILSGGKTADDPDAKMSIVESTRNMIRSAVEEGLNAGRDAAAIIDKIADAAFSPARAAFIAEEEVFNAAGAAALIGFKSAKEAGSKVKKAWRTIGDEMCCDECAENEAAGFIDVDEDFPSGHQSTPAHVKCRCRMAYGHGRNA